jgi:HAD superfamily hydrolase (TIGR01484 family)
MKNLNSKKLIVFDLDGTLAPTKAQMDQEMAELVKKLLEVKKVAIIGGGKLQLFKHQFLSQLKIPNELYHNLSLFPTTGTTYLKYQNGPHTFGRGKWKRVYAHDLSKEQVKKIRQAFAKVFKEINYVPAKKIYGKSIENRGSQVTWSALGQDVVKVLGKKGIELKNKWRDENTPLKLKIAMHLRKYLPDLEVHAAGHTSIDITKKGIDKGYGLRQMEKYLKVKIKDMLFVGDAIFPGGNDYAVVKTGVDYKKVKDPEETKKIIRQLI